MFLLAACGAQTLAGEDPKPPAPTPEPAWVAVARDAKLTAPAIAQLRERHLLVTRDESKQIFEPYLHAKRPFITTDSILAAYHVLLEASVARLEAARAARLPGLLREVWDALPRVAAGALASGPDDATRRAAALRAELALAVAMRLVGAETPGLSKLSADAEALVESEVRAVVEAKGRAQPAWLGPFDEDLPCIDYDSHRPRGFYDADDTLRAYFRAVRWLQSVAFRDDLPAEKTAAQMLDGANRTCGRHLGDFAAAFAAVGGPWRRDAVLSRSQRVWAIEDVIEEAPSEAEPPPQRDDNPERTVRLVFPPCEPPENPLLREIAAPHSLRPLPDALDLGIGLGSSYAEAVARTDPAVQPRPKLGALRSAAAGRSLFAGYIHAISALVDDPEPDAPPFLGNDAWRAKSLATALAGWAQARHTFVLQADENAAYGCDTITHAGFVEPDPEFFERLAALTGETLRLLEEQGAFGGEIAAQQVRSDLLELANWLSAHAGTGDSVKPSDGRPAWGLIWAKLLGLDVAPARLDRSSDPVPRTAEFAAVRHRLAADLRSRAAQLPYPLPRRISAEFENRNTVLVASWRDLAEACATLASMAHRQLRRVPWTADDAAFFRGYGRRLARLHLYFGESWAEPRDDAPRTVSVQTLVDDAGVQRSWHVGVGRPRTIVVLWPTASGEEVLCAGAVLPFHETVEDHRLTDDEWRGRFGEGGTRPPDPAWLAPSLAPEK